MPLIIDVIEAQMTIFDLLLLDQTKAVCVRSRIDCIAAGQDPVRLGVDFHDHLLIRIKTAVDLLPDLLHDPPGLLRSSRTPGRQCDQKGAKVFLLPGIIIADPHKRTCLARDHIRIRFMRNDLHSSEESSEIGKGILRIRRQFKVDITSAASHLFSVLIVYDDVLRGDCPGELLKTRSLQQRRVLCEHGRDDLPQALISLRFLIVGVCPVLLRILDLRIEHGQHIAAGLAGLVHVLQEHSHDSKNSDYDRFHQGQLRRTFPDHLRPVSLLLILPQRLFSHHPLHREAPCEQSDHHGDHKHDLCEKIAKNSCPFFSHVVAAHDRLAKLLDLHREAGILFPVFRLHWEKVLLQVLF